MNGKALFLGAAFFVALSARGQGSSPLSETETYITAMAAQGEEADLQDKFPGQTNKWIVRGKFLEQLLTTTNYPVHRRGVILANAIFTNALDLENAEVNCDTLLSDCRFDGDVTMEDSHFSRNLLLSGCHFAGVVNLERIKVDSAMFLRSARFEQGLLLGHSHIGGQLIANKVQFTGSSDVDVEGATIGEDVFMSGSTNEGKVDFGNMTVGGDMYLDGVFEGEVDFTHTTIRGSLLAEGGQFTSPTAEVSFNSVQVDGFAKLKGAIFSGPVNFTAARIAGNFQADDTQFLNPTNEATFNSMSVGGFASFGGAVFSGSVDFTAAHILSNLEADDTQFQSPTNPVSFNSINVGGFASFGGAVFSGPVDFTTAHILSNLQADDTQFQSPTNEASFNSVNVGGFASFDGAVFSGPVDFTASHILSNLQADDTKFLSATNKATFNSMSVGGFASFERAVFNGPVDFTEAHISGNLQAAYTQFLSPNNEATFNSINVGGHAFFYRAVFAGTVDFSRSEIAGDFRAVEVQFTNDLASLDGSTNNFFNADFDGMHVGGDTSFRQAVFGGKLSLMNARFGNLDLSVANVPAEVGLDNMTFQTIKAAGKSRVMWNNLKSLVNKESDYRPDVYLELEDFFRREGEPEQADLVLYAQKHEERKAVWRSAQGFWKKIWVSPRIIGSYLLKWLVGYGRHPENALFYSMAVVIFGWWVFRYQPETRGKLRKMEPQDPGKAERVYNAFWYSLDLFAPAIDLYAANYWKPKSDPQFRFARRYVRFHRLLGWILVPIGLAALTGLI